MALGQGLTLRQRGVEPGLGKVVVETGVLPLVVHVQLAEGHCPWRGVHVGAQGAAWRFLDVDLKEKGYYGSAFLIQPENELCMT